MCHLVVFGGGRPVAFCSYLATAEDDLAGRAVPVLYCYQLHVCRAARRRGLGRLLVRRLEAIAARRQQPPLEKVMLTCFTANAAALRFYRRLDYLPDPISPSRCLPAAEADACAYEILSRRL